MSDILNNISNNLNKNVQKGQNELPFVLSQLEKYYDDFCAKMQKSDFCNSPRRYIVEKSYVDNLLSEAKKQNITSEIEKWSKKSEEIAQKLKAMGIIINK